MWKGLMDIKSYNILSSIKRLHELCAYGLIPLLDSNQIPLHVIISIIYKLPVLNIHKIILHLKTKVV